MKRLPALSLVCLLSASLISCTKETAPTQESNAIAPETLAQIRALGFSTADVQRQEGGFLVEGDILLSPDQLGEAPTSPNLIIAQEEQYHTFNTVNAGKHAVITVALDNSSAQHQAAFSAALDEAIRRYNAEGLSIRFQKATGRADIKVTAYYQVSNVLGSAGFPSKSGDPYRQIKMNTYHYSTSTGSTNINYIATIMAHEMGHCIGFRHTDYMNRSYSCGAGGGGNEGQTTSGVGAVHIPGTPTGPDANSWMLACIGDNDNRPFNTNDRTALKYLY